MSGGQVKSVCPYCGVGCGIVLSVEAGRVTKVAGDKTHSANKGRLCTKGQSCHVPLYEGRLSSAYQKLDGTREQKPVPMRDAIAETARRLGEIMAEHGSDAVSFYISGQMSLEAQYLANKLAKGFIGTRHIEANSRLCMASAASGYKLSLGADAPPGSYDDFDKADVFLVIGANMADCHPILFLRLLDRVKQGAKLIVVDPRRTATAEKADLFLQLKPGTDIALLNGILSLLWADNQIDPKFIAAHTEGWAQMQDFLADYTLDKVANITGLAAADIERAARLIGARKNFMSCWTMGLNQSVSGTWNANALCNLHLATGAICQPGAGPFSLTGQPNAMGGREMGYMGPGLPGQRSALSAEDRSFAEKIWKLPDGTLRTAEAIGTVDMFDEIKEGRIRAIWIICTNPVATMPARGRTVAALKAAELVIVQDAYLDTETNPYADILLPGALWAEADGVMVNSERNMTLARQAVEPPGEAMVDWRIIAEVAQAMGYAGFDYAGSAEVFEELKLFANPQTGYDIRGASHERLAETPLQWPCAPDAGARNPIRYIEKGAPVFPTSSGLAKFYPRPHMEPAELPDDEYPFVLNTGRVQHQWHTLTKTGKVPHLNKLNAGPFVEIHPQDAARLGLGERVEIISRRGRAVLPVAVSDRVQPGNCFAPFHWNDVFGDELAVNEVTSAAVDAISLQPAYKFCAIALRPAVSPVLPLPPAEEPDMNMIAPLARFLGLDTGSLALSADERLYMQGFLQGVALRPDGLPVLPSTAPMEAARRIQLNGLLAGLISRADAVVAPAPPEPELRVLYASQTGTAEAFARGVAKKLAVSVQSLDEVTPATLTGTVLFVVSTFGDGDAPDNGAAFWCALQAAEAPRLSNLRFAVLAFGDSSYAQFCGFGARLEERLAALGAQPLLPRENCEPDYEETAGAWLARAREALQVRVPVPAGDVPPARPPSTHDRQKPFTARLVGRRVLNEKGAAKETRHVIFDLAESGLTYVPGDVLGVWPENDPVELAAFLQLTGVQELDDTYDITRLTPALVKICAARNAKLAAKLAQEQDFLWGRQLIDLLREFPIQAEHDEWLSVLKPLAPRLYSISSSLSAHPGEVHLTMNVLRYEFAGRERGGLCSRFLADRAEVARVFIQRSAHFRLPEDDSTPIIMIGPGTGVAPFRAFLQERRARGACGKSWLFFGEQHEATDFYYRDELEALQRDGYLHRLDTAFSRDQAEKIYVQDRMRAAGAELWAWLQQGAHVYVCGDAARMAKDVDASLRAIVAAQGDVSDDEAALFVEGLAKAKRYVRDVY